MAALTCSIHPPNGFHPTLLTKVSHLPRGHDSGINCTLHLYYTLPPLLFIDPYELEHRRDTYTFRYWGANNLELPVTAILREEAGLLLHVKNKLSEDVGDERAIEVEVPMHLRYGEPENGGYIGLEEVKVGWPKGFFACPSASADSLPHPSTPLNLNLPPHVSSLFDSSSFVLLPIFPATAKENAHELAVRVPLGNVADTAFVEFGTAITIVLCCVYVGYTALGAAAALRQRNSGSHTVASVVKVE